MSSAKLTESEKRQMLEHVTGPAPKAPRSHMRAVLLVILIAAAVVITVTAIDRNYREKKRREEHAAIMAELMEEVKSFQSVMEENIPKEMKSFPYYKNAKITASAVWVPGNADTTGSRLTDRITVTVYAYDTFDSLDDRSIYEWLQEVYLEYSPRIWDAYDKHLPNYRRHAYYFNLYKRDSDIEPEEEITYRQEFSYFIKTSKNSYEQTNLVRDYYVLNGKDHFVKTEKKKQTTPAPTSAPGSTPTSAPKPTGTPSGSSGTGGKRRKTFEYYGVEEYDDPEDFYYDYEDDFEDYEDAEDYWNEYH